MSRVGSFIISDTHITFFTPSGISGTVYKTDENFSTVCEAAVDRDWDKVISLSSPAESIRVFGEGKITVADGCVWYNDKPLHTSLTDRIIQMTKEGFNCKPIVNFLDNLMDNVSERAIDELYGFLEYGKLPITEDGYFLAYKKVREDYTDCHTGTFDNSPGQIVEMPRDEVTDDKNQTCAAGLHFCSYEYLKSFGGERVVVLKINPKDVVSIPVDYNNTKGRCCQYEVVRDLSEMKEMGLTVYIGTLTDTAMDQSSSTQNETNNR